MKTISEDNFFKALQQSQNEIPEAETQLQS